jgi:secondary thiamine-phosphate synthase enzyme
VSRWVSERLIVETRGRGFTNVTARLRESVARVGVVSGSCTVFVRHTSAILVIQENADPAVLRDLERWLSEIAPESRRWEHSDEGPDDMPAHARSTLTRSSETIPVLEGQLALGTWQGVYLWEHRRAPHQRELIVQVAGE